MQGAGCPSESIDLHTSLRRKPPSAATKSSGLAPGSPAAPPAAYTSTRVLGVPRYAPVDDERHTSHRTARKKCRIQATHRPKGNAPSGYGKRLSALGWRAAKQFFSLSSVVAGVSLRGGCGSPSLGLEKEMLKKRRPLCVIHGTRRRATSVRDDWVAGT